MDGIVLNGRARAIGGARTVAELLRELGLEGKRIAVERNGEIVPRSRYGETRVVEGDRFDVIGRSYVVIYSNKPVAGANGRFYFMGAGDRFDMKERKATRQGTEWRPLQGVRPPS